MYFLSPVGIALMLMLGDGGEGKKFRCAVTVDMVKYFQHERKINRVLSKAQRQATIFSLAVSVSLRLRAT